MHFKILYQILSFSQMVPYSFLFYTLMTIISSRSKVGLQNSLNTLYSFSSSWMLDIISKKTKIVIFQERAKKNYVVGRYQHPLFSMENLRLFKIEGFI